MLWKNRLLSLFFILLLCPLNVQGKGFSTVYVLGDSLSDQGNLFQATLALTGLGIPAEDHYYLGRFSNGGNYVDLLADKLDLFIAPTCFGGGNFAYGAARTDYNSVEQYLPVGAYPWSLNLQRMEFSGQAIDDPEALYVVFSGSNDMADLIGAVLTQGPDVAGPVLGQVVEGIRQTVEAFIAAGARDILVPLIPDLGLVPLVTRQDPLPGLPPDSTLVAQTATALTAQLNMAIVEMLKNYPEINIIVFDTFSALRQIVATPDTYGLENVDEPCYTGFMEPAGPEDTVCDNPDTYLFWDAEHPTTATHQVFADLMLRTMIDAMLEDFGDDLQPLASLPKNTTSLIQKLARIKQLLADENRHNDLAAIANLNVLGKMLEMLERSSLVDIDASALSARARQIAELVEASRY